MKFALSLVLVVAGLGCTGFGNVAKSLKDDPAIVILNVGTPWGIQKLVRVGGQSNEVTVTIDGEIKIKPIQK